MWCRIYKKKHNHCNIKVSQQGGGSTKEALSLARREHVTRSVSPNLGTIPGPGYTGLIQGCVFPLFTVFWIYKGRQKIPNKCKRETTVLVGNITKAECVPWELLTTIQTGLFCVKSQTVLFTTDSNILYSDATLHQRYMLQYASLRNGLGLSSNEIILLCKKKVLS